MGTGRVIRSLPESFTGHVLENRKISWYGQAHQESQASSASLGVIGPVASKNAGTCRGLLKDAARDTMVLCQNFDAGG